MMRHLRPRRLVNLALMALLWSALWRDLSLANLLVGAGIGALVTAAGVGTTGRGGIRLWPLLRLSGLVLVDLLRSTLSVATEILTPTDRTDESIIKVDLGAESRDHLLLLIVAVTLTPGTAVVDADPDTGTLYLHLLHHKRSAATIAHVEELARLAHAALPTKEGAQP